MLNNLNQPVTDGEPRLTLKRVARRLIAEHGVRDVSVRQIATEAGQKNMGAVAYYFGTKDKLVAEILIDGAMRIEARRHQYLADVELDGGPKSISSAVEAIVLPSVEFADNDDEYGLYFNRFLLQLSSSNPDLIDQTLDGRWNKGYQRCLQHLRQFMGGLSRDEQNRRFLFLGSYVSSLLAQREVMLADTSHAHPTWRSHATLRDIIHTAAAILQAPISNS